MRKLVNSWQELGERIAMARKHAGLTQDALAHHLGIDRTAVTRLESGDRRVGAVELCRIAELVERPLEWFVSGPVAPVTSARGDTVVETRAEILLDAFARDVRQLMEIGALKPVRPPLPDLSINRPQDAEVMAGAARKALGSLDEPIRDLARAAEQLGLYVLPYDLEPPAPEGCYCAVGEAGAALINSRQDLGRRRFTLAHELGHHMLANEYSLDWDVFGDEQGEKTVNAFAIHFLMPKAGVTQEWKQLEQEGLELRQMAVVVAAKFGASWTAACSHLARLGCLSPNEAEQIRGHKPSRGDYLELAVQPPDGLGHLSLPPRFTAAAIKAYRQHKIGAGRAVELLRGTLGEDRLPEPYQAPMDAFRSDLDPI